MHHLLHSYAFSFEFHRQLDTDLSANIQQCLRLASISSLNFFKWLSLRYVYLVIIDHELYIYFRNQMTFFFNISQPLHFLCLAVCFQQREVKPYWNLSVKVLYAKIHRSYDYCEKICPLNSIQIYSFTNFKWNFFLAEV